MSIFSRIFGNRSKERVPEHAVIVHFDYGRTELQPIFDLGEQLETAILGAVAGEFDGDEVASDCSEGYLYMYGPDGDRLFAIVRPILEQYDFMRGARVKVRYGPPSEDTAEVQHTLQGAP